VLVDTSVWVDHLRRRNARLAAHLERSQVCCHPFVIGELACGRLRRRDEILCLLAALPQAPLAEHGEVLTFVESNRLAGAGIGWIDAHLLASARLAHSTIWTLDRRLDATARSLGIRAEP
jgi:predicted nucleic acid-binding protein